MCDLSDFCLFFAGDFVAVKKYEVAEIPEKELQLLVEEANLMRSLNHENIVQVESEREKEKGRGRE